MYIHTYLVCGQCHRETAVLWQAGASVVDSLAVQCHLKHQEVLPSSDSAEENEIRS